MTAAAKVLVLALALALAGCSGDSGGPSGPNLPPPSDEPGMPNDPGTPPQNGVQGSYVLEQINGSQPGQLVTMSNPDGTVIGLYRFEVTTTLTLDALQTFQLELRYTDDKSQFGIDDAGEFKQAGPVSQDGALPLAFYSAAYDDQFTGVVLGDIVAVKYDFDGDGELDTSFGFRRAD